MIQFYIFGITLQLYREFAGSLWANMLFHLVCLETVRFVFMSSSQSIIKFHETQQGVFGIIGLFLGLYIGSAIILSILLWLRKESPKIKSIIRVLKSTMRRSLLTYIILVFVLTYSIEGLVYLIGGLQAFSIIASLTMLFPAITAIIVWAIYYRDKSFGSSSDLD